MNLRAKWRVRRNIPKPYRRYAVGVDYGTTGDQTIIELAFPNGWGASVAQGRGNYAGKHTWELAVLRHGEITHMPGDLSRNAIMGWLPRAQVERTLAAIMELP